MWRGCIVRGPLCSFNTFRFNTSRTIDQCACEKIMSKLEELKKQNAGLQGEFDPLGDCQRLLLWL